MKTIFLKGHVTTSFLAALMLFFTLNLLQAQRGAVAHTSHHEAAQPWPKFRAALLLGHTLVSGKQAEGSFFIPSWGLDLEYWPSDRWGLGLHNDIELETFVLIGPEGEDIERINPLVLTLDALWQFQPGWIISFGPGIEIESSENYPLLRFGLEYEIAFGKHFDVSPTIFYDQRLDGYHTWSIALGIGKRF